MGIPIQSSCDMTNPEEQALWALVALPGPGATAPLVLPVDVMRQWSQRLYDCGFRHHPEEQTVKYVPPGPDTDWVMGAAGRWVPIDEPLDAGQTAPDISHLTMAEKQVLLRRLETEIHPETPEGTEDTARVIEDE